MINLALVAGGYSSEYVVSVKSAKGILQNLDSSKYRVYELLLKQDSWTCSFRACDYPVNRADFSVTINGQKLTFDCAYIIIHGHPGEDGTLQGYFDLLNIPYTSCNLETSALTFNKFLCNSFLKAHGINVAPSLLLKQGDVIDATAVEAQLGLPLFVKPNNGGSSFGISKVKHVADIEPAISKAFKESNQVIIESFLMGTEFTNGVVRTAKEEFVLPITEVVPQNEFFDYEAKYVAGKAEEITPARLTEERTAECKAISLRVARLLNCSGIVRIDYILQADKFFVLEVNTVPGMTPTSFIPQQIVADGREIGQVLDLTIADCMR